MCDCCEWEKRDKAKEGDTVQEENKAQKYDALTDTVLDTGGARIIVKIQGPITAAKETLTIIYLHGSSRLEVQQWVPSN